MDKALVDNREVIEAKSSKAKFPGKPGIIFAAKHVLAPHWETGCFIGVPETTPAPTLRADATGPAVCWRHKHGFGF